MTAVSAQSFITAHSAERSADPADQPGTGDCAAAVDGAGSAGHPVMP